jgi:hypothetical protein
MMKVIPLFFAASLLATPLHAGEGPSSMHHPRLSRLTILEDNYPKCFFFRLSENVGGPLSEYGLWEKNFGRLMGVEGKILNEEIYTDPNEKIKRFAAFKKAHPSQLALLHFNGGCRDPRYEMAPFFAGHWLYYNGAKIIDDLPAAPGEAVIRVSDASLFGVGIGIGGKKVNEDVGLCLLDADGKPDWSRAEQVQLLSVDPMANTIRVRRGAYGTTPRAFPAGTAYAAAHCSDGPWGTRDNDIMMWFYNFSTQCPKDAEGKNCAEVQSSFLQSLFARGGKLEPLDGLEFDVLWGYPYIVNACRFNTVARQPDCDADGIGDDGVIAGVNTFQAGVYDFIAKLREKLGQDRLILADGTRHEQQRAFGLLNGIETESFPHNDDPGIKDWSGGINRLLFWRGHTFEPRFQYTAHKFDLLRQGGKPAEDGSTAVPFSTHRLVLAVNALTDTATAIQSGPGREPDGTTSIWDELRMGTKNRLGWLGKPLGPLRRLALDTPDLLQEEGNPPAQALLAHFQSDDAVLELDGSSIRMQAKDPKASGFGVRIEGIPAQGPDLYVSMTLRAEPMAGQPRDLARLLWVGVAGDQLLVTSDKPVGGVMPHNGEAEQGFNHGARVQYKESLELGTVARACYQVHPPYRDNKKGAVYWQKEIRVTDGSELTFYTGMALESLKKSDGVSLSVWVAPVTEGEPQFSKLWAEDRRETTWVKTTVSLQDYVGRKIILRFVTDCGPADNTTTDHTFWGDVTVLGKGDRPEALTPPVRFNTWVTHDTFTAGFYLRDVRSSTVDLELLMESSGPLWLDKMTVHAAPDAMLREFENGLVLVNPSLRPFAFDLKKLIPANRYRRLEGSSNQDTETNNGAEAGEAVTLAPLDGLFLLRETGSK